MFVDIEDNCTIPDSRMLSYMDILRQLITKNEDGTTTLRLILPVVYFEKRRKFMEEVTEAVVHQSVKKFYYWKLDKDIDLNNIFNIEVIPTTVFSYTRNRTIAGYDLKLTLCEPEVIMKAVNHSTLMNPNGKQLIIPWSVQTEPNRIVTYHLGCQYGEDPGVITRSEEFLHPERRYLC